MPGLGLGLGLPFSGGPQAPRIVTQPQSVTVDIGDPASFSVVASGFNLSYQWEVSTDGGVSWTPLVGETSSTLLLASVTYAQNGYLYRVIVSDPDASITSSAATLTVNFAPVGLLPELYLDAALEPQSGPAPQVAANFGTGGSVLNARYGSSSGADTNDPTLLTWTGENYLYLPGVSGNFASAPPNAAYDSEDADIAFCVAYDAIPVGALPLYVGVGDTASAGQYRALLAVQSNSTLRYFWHDGTTGRTATSTQPAPLVAGDFLWLRATMDYNPGGTYEVRFYVSTDVTSGTPSWTQLGDPLTGAQLANLPVSGKGIGVSLSGQAGTAAKVRRAVIRDGINGTVVFDADFTTGITTGAQTTFTESSSNAATVTINRSTSGRKSVAVVRPTWLFGTDDYMSIPDNALLDFDAGDSFTVVYVGRLWGTASTPLVAKKTVNVNDAGYSLLTQSGLVAGRIADGSVNTVSAVAFISGSMFVASHVRNVGADTNQVVVSGTSSSNTDVTTGSLANSLPLQIGFINQFAYASMELLAVLLFRRALTAAEIGQLVTYYGTA